MFMQNLKKIQQKIHFGKLWVIEHGIVFFSLWYFLDLKKILDNENVLLF